MKNLILTDCDGCLLAWEDHFHEYMRSHGHQRAYDDKSDVYWKEQEYPGLSQFEAKRMVYHFNTSAWMLAVPPFRDAVDGIHRLYENGYRFVAITAMGIDPYARQARQINLDQTFGEGVFVELITTDMYDENSKVPALTEYADSAICWVEDKWSNYVLGRDLGIRSFLMDHPHNQKYSQADMDRVNNWSDICDRLL